jgi:asparagine synthase (glutamine-hydrolysing)
LSACITEAVGRQLISDVPIGTFLSGGVDSPLVTSVARGAGGAEIPAFSIGTTDPRFDESAGATGYARHFGVEHHLRTFQNEDSLDLIESVATAYSEPFADYSSFPSLLVSAVARDKVKVALSGDGGDELFWGYPRFEKVLRARHWFTYPRVLRLAVRAGGKLQGSNWPPSGIKAKSIGDWYFDSHSGFTSNVLKSICPEAAQLPDEFSLYRLQDVPNEEELAYWLRNNEIMGHLQMILLKMDRASMYHGLEVRVPLLDLDVVECAFRIAPSECMGRGLGKLPLRKILARSTPTELIPREKSGFTVPMDDWLKGELRPCVEDLLLNQEPFPSGVFRRADLQELYREHLDGRQRTRGLWSLLALQLWSQRHLK